MRLLNLAILLAALAAAQQPARARVEFKLRVPGLRNDWHVRITPPRDCRPYRYDSYGHYPYGSYRDSSYPYGSSYGYNRQETYREQRDRSFEAANRRDEDEFQTQQENLELQRLLADQERERADDARSHLSPADARYREKMRELALQRLRLDIEQRRSQRRRSYAQTYGSYYGSSYGSSCQEPYRVVTPDTYELYSYHPRTVVREERVEVRRVERQVERNTTPAPEPPPKKPGCDSLGYPTDW